MSLNVIADGSGAVTTTTNGELWVLGTGSTLDATGSPAGFYATHDDVSLHAAGTILADTYGIRYDVAVSGGHVDIDASATISSAYALYVASASAQIVNDGSIVGSTIGAALDGDGTSMVNDGTVKGGLYGGVLSSDNETMINNGRMKGNTTGFLFDAATGNSLFVNHGKVIGEQKGVWWFAGTSDHCVFVNTGLVKVTGTSQAVVGNAAGDTLINTGRIKGDVALGDGDDTVDGRGGSITGQVDVGAGNDLVHLGGGDDDLLAGAGGDAVYGGGGDDAIDGSSGGDLLSGEAGNDVLLGGTGDDVLRGGTGRDRLNGGLDEDIINGGKGRDVLFGGPDADVFAFGIKAGNDTVKDYVDGTDLIDLSAFDLAGFAPLSAAISARHGDARIHLDDLGGVGTITVKDAAGHLDAGDFLL